VGLLRATIVAVAPAPLAPFGHPEELGVEAVRIIRNEHRSLAAVMHGMVYLVREIRDRGVRPDFALLGAMIYYIDTFPERLHHPKEDKYLFRLLRMRCAEAAPLLDRLEQEHRTGAAKIRALEQALARFQQGGMSEFPAFASAADTYADFHWQHMRTEEKEVLPLAEKHLTAGDWEAIDAAFTDNSDPLFGAEAGQAYDQLFQRIVNLAPPPIGVGPMR
jgi:hemerythrin-like domain-containing protein